jgi:hypothetical protein
MVRQCFDAIMQIDGRSRGALAPTLTAEQVDMRISLPIGRGGMGMRPFSRFSHAAYFSSLATVLPDFCSSFPNHPDVSASALHADLEECRSHLLQAGIERPVKSLKEIHKLGGEGARGPYKKRTASGDQPGKSQRRPFSFLSHTAAPPPPLVSTRDLLHADLSSLWALARACVGDAQKTHTFLRDRHLQHDLTALLELQLHEQLFASSNKYQRIVLTALALTKKANAWLTVLPTSHELRMSDSSFRLAVRHRLGLLPYDTLRSRRCRYRGCDDAATFMHDPDHLHSCPLHRRTLCSARHNDLMQTLITLARKVGFHAVREPNHHIRPQPNADATDLSKFNEHADILLLKHDRRIYIDVTVTRPTNATNSARAGITSVPLLSTQARASAKHSKYAAISRENGYEFVAFVLESYGGINGEAHDLLATLASHAVEEDQSAFLQFAHQCISVSLQRSNAFIAQVGTQMLHTEEQRLGGLADSQIKARQKRKEEQEKAAAAVAEASRIASLISTEESGDSDDTQTGRQRQQQQLAGKRRQFSQRGLLSPSSSRKNAAQRSAAATLQAPPLLDRIRHDPLLPPSPSLLLPSPPRVRARKHVPSPASAAPSHIHPSRLPQLAALLLPHAGRAVNLPAAHALPDSIERRTREEERMNI